MKRLDGYVPQRESSKEIQDFLQLLVYLLCIMPLHLQGYCNGKCIDNYTRILPHIQSRHCYTIDNVEKFLNKFFDKKGDL